MAGEIITPNMNLVVPGVGAVGGPQYATDVNNSLTILDAHSHVAGSGVLITPAALNINTSLTLQDNTLFDIGGLTFAAQTSTPANFTGYVNGVDLFFVDGSGNNIQLTRGGTVNATSSGISSGTASASFVGGALVVNSAALTPANIQAGSVLFGNNVASSNFVTVQPQNSLASSYSLTLPILPSTLSVMTLDNVGNIGTESADAVGQAMTSTGANAIANTRTRGTPIATAGAAGSVVASNSCGSSFITSLGIPVAVNNLSVTLVTTGRPVCIMLQPPSNGTSSNFFVQTNNNILNIVVVNVNTGTAFNFEYAETNGGAASPGIVVIDSSSLVAGNYTWEIVAYVNTGTGLINDCVLVAYEL